MKIPGHEFDFEQIVDDFVYINAYFWNFVRHTFILSYDEKQKIWKAVEKLLIDNQVEIWQNGMFGLPQQINVGM
ncbi:hypothetical protein HanRHA438_Chr04g0169191 [Helianthus annuus]|nr:hypothetical protein HanRHA438_Chr04g0169191 [Helianthus annuus]